MNICKISNGCLRMLTKFKFLLAFLFLTGCIASTSKMIKLNSTFNAKDAVKFLEKGKNKIEGNALIRQRAGGVVTCAGTSVTLFPVNEYSKERIFNIYGNLNKGYRSANLPTVQFDNNDPNYFKAAKNVICDPQGYFTFKDIVDGEFFVVSKITWNVQSYLLEGGFLMQRVSLNGGETKKIVLSP